MRVRVLGPARLLLTVVFVCGAPAIACTSGGKAAMAPGHHECPPGEETRVIEGVNAARRAAGTPPLVRDARLGRIATARAAAMAAAGRLSHGGWEEALRDGGIEGRVLGENVAFGYASATAVMQRWLASRGHRANVLNPRFGSIGVGCVVDTSGRRWWSQDFAGR